LQTSLKQLIRHRKARKPRGPTFRGDVGFAVLPKFKDPHDPPQSR
jgi:hypothetical protein